MTEIKEAIIKNKLQATLSDGYLETVSDRALVVGFSKEKKGDKTISLLFSRTTVIPTLGVATEKPFELSKRYVANITMQENVAKKLALDILHGLGIKSLEAEEKDVPTNEV